MLRVPLCSAIVALTPLLGLLLARDTSETSPQQARSSDAADSSSLQGIWSGSWGLGESDGAILQPVLASLVIHQDRAILKGFRGVDHFSGTLHVDRDQHQLRITQTEHAHASDTKTLVYTYKLTGDDLTLTEADRNEIYFRKRSTTPQAQPAIALRLVEATRIDDQSRLHLVEYTNLQVPELKTVFFSPSSYTLDATQASIWIVADDALQSLTLDEARRHLESPTLIALTHRPDKTPADAATPSPDALWREAPSFPDSSDGQTTLAKTLRPGLLIFVFPTPQDVVPSP